jgi:hypothetical protein
MVMVAPLDFVLAAVQVSTMGFGFAEEQPAACALFDAPISVAPAIAAAQATIATLLKFGRIVIGVSPYSATAMRDITSADPRDNPSEATAARTCFDRSTASALPPL